ncbi:DUF2868 domain-containing protein [Aquincola sp. MAHUQ-54]|uniref:DUF2868 domain-containing protein n=1 Tax=Aquincola agrisoli TaxID=3119538 RepID=A0AAW9QJQ5_9BURK
MTEDDARRFLLLRAYEAPLAPPWTDADALAATEAAARSVGEQGGAERFLAARAAEGTARLLPREPAAGRALQATGRPRWIGAALVALALAIGLASPVLGPSKQLNLLAPPLLALLCWNLLVYAAIAAAALRRDAPPGALRRWLAGVPARVGGAAPGASATPAARFLADWSRRAAPLWSARAACWLHAAAAALVAGLLGAMYLRGLAFEYRAGWDSTFLSAEAVRALLSAVLGPASALSGIALPSADELARLRFSAGPGENAARWIHLHAITAALVVLLPRALLAVSAAWRARRLARRFPLALDDAYAQRLLRSHRGDAAAVRVLPYSYQPTAQALDGLRSVMAHSFGPRTEVQVDAPMRQGDEERLADVPGTGAAPGFVLFALSATPERETHGAVAEALPGARLLVDESGFAQRFGATRTAQRREAWTRMLAGLQRTPIFIDLAAPDLAATDAALQRG